MEKNKLVLIIGGILILISIGLSATSVFMTKTALSYLDGTAEVTDESTGEDTTVPISQQIHYEFEDSLVQIYISEDGEKTMSVSLSIGVALDGDNDASTDELETITNNEGILKDRISKLLSNKTFEYMSQDGVEDKLQDEILIALIEALDSESVVEVYFPDGLLKSVR
jgi:flagellar basal body-associated protein FliL